MRCNNRHDLLHLSFTLKISVFSGVHTWPSQRYMMELILQKYKADKYIHKKAPSQMLAWVLNTPLLFEDSSSALFFQRIFHYPVGNSIFKVSNRNTKTRCEICSKLIIKTSERRHCRRSGVFIVDLEHISHLFLVFL